MGRVFWDKGSGLFYEEGRDGPLSTREAFSRIRYNPESERFIDDKGRFVPSWVSKSALSSERQIFAHDDAGNVRVSANLRTELVDPDSLAGRRIQQNEQVTVRIVYRLPDGTVQETFVSGGLGRTVDVDELIALGRQKADADIRQRQGKTYLPSRSQAARDMAEFEISVEVQIVSINRV